MTETRAYKIWINMKRRCYDEKCDGYPNYGGRGIKVSLSWRYSFAAFYADMGDPAPGQSLDRIDVNDSYYKENCRWASWKQQMNNTRSNTLLTFEDEEKSISMWSEEPRVVAIGLSKKTISTRLCRGWCIIDALTVRPGEVRSVINEANS